MRHQAVLSCVVLGVVLLTLVGASPMAGVAFADLETVSPEEALAQDLSLTAEGREWTLDEAATQHRAAEVIGEIAVQLSSERPEVFVGSALSEEPGGAPTLYVKGPADEFVRGLVDASDIDIVLADGQPYSFDELEARKLRVHHALVALGFREVVTRVNITGAGLIPAAVTIVPGLPIKREEVLLALPSDLRGSVELTVSETSIATDTSSFGGMMVKKNNENYATSGWSVRDTSSQVTGVTTAGHALGADAIVHPGHGTHSFVFQSEHRGEWGDIEWHTTNSAEIAQFYSLASIIASVLALEPRAGIAVNESVCQYGRFSNSRDCSLDVFDVSIACTIDGVFNNRLVQMDAITPVVGDSGGGWSYGSKAYGSQKGHCASKDAWSVADLFDEALGVKVILD